MDLRVAGLKEGMISSRPGLRLEVTVDEQRDRIDDPRGDRDGDDNEDRELQWLNSQIQNPNSQIPNPNEVRTRSRGTEASGRNTSRGPMTRSPLRPRSSRASADPARPVHGSMALRTR